MILVTRADIGAQALDRLREHVELHDVRTYVSRGPAELRLGCIGGDEALDRLSRAELPDVVARVVVKTPYRRAARPFAAEPTRVRIGVDTVIGADALVVVAGPCSVEGREMLREAAWAVRGAGAAALRGGAFKPRSSPYAFQGLGEEGLRLLAEVRAETGLPIVTEVMDTRQVDLVAGYADVLQIGARNMQNFSLLAEVGRVRRPVLLKRGLSATLEELLMAAEHIMARGNSEIVLCERGIRTFETATRNTLDLSAIPVLKRETHLPVLVDPSHAAGRADMVAPLAFGAVAAGADGLIVEVHPTPATARSDGAQSLEPAAFERMMRQLALFAHAAGRSLGQPRPLPVQEAA
jgi:3-deoxy-7-phosphoheptulonate synthase